MFVQYKSKFGYLGMPLSEQIFRFVGYFAGFSWFITVEFIPVHFSYITRNALQFLSVVAQSKNSYLCHVTKLMT